MNVGYCVLTLYPPKDKLESRRRERVLSETPGGAYLICIVFIVYQHPCLLLIHMMYQKMFSQGGIITVRVKIRIGINDWKMYIIFNLREFCSNLFC